ncbi:MAG: HAMP domain-containing protein [Actinobacteria bacterium]|nr:HAMP domain-containing protein [Actinomycetota bacterium]MBO0788869.1 HAMP domain-containing protein [Actinomycetota bacterium]
MPLRHLAASVAARSRLPQRTIRLRLTALYAVLFLLSGAGLLAITYVLVSAATASNCYRQPLPTASHHPAARAACLAPGAHGGSAPAGMQALAASQHASTMDQLLVYSGVALGIMAVASAGLGWVMAGRALRPLRAITATARQISATSLDRRLALTGPGDEITELGNTIDDLLSRLEAAFAAQRQFAANASHELRTPLAWQKTLIQVTLADPDASAGSLRAAHERVLAAGAQQERIIEALLMLTRGQAGLARRDQFDLADLVGQVIAARQADALDRRLRLHTALASAPAAGDPRLAERLIANLADNALRHNTPGGYAEIVTATRGSHAVLMVTNTGPVVPAEAAGQLLQPFQRLGTDRTGHGHGLGLGLSIVKAIADAHAAHLTIRPQPGGGLQIEVAFPQPATSSAAGTQAHVPPGAPRLHAGR